MRTKVVFYLNGQKHELGPDQAQMMLSDYLRLQKQLTGTKVVCAEGDCGACTVLRYFPLGKSQFFLPVNSCIATVAQMDGSSLVTIEGLGRQNLSPVQKAMVECHGSQCGFCTPGFVMALTGLVEKKKILQEQGRCISEKEAKNALTGNLCRCTGYQAVLDAAQNIDISKCDSIVQNFLSKEIVHDLKKNLNEPVFLKEESFQFIAPIKLKEAVAFLKKNTDARLVGALTDLGVVHNKYKIRLKKTLSLHLIKDLYSINREKNRMTVGARVTLTELRKFIQESIPEFARFLDLFASPQIKNVATLVGNIANASPIADTPPVLLVLNGNVEVIGPRGKREIALDQFFLGYRKTDLKKGEFVVSVSFDIPSKSERLSIRKISQRKDLDISAVNAAFRVRWNANRTKIEDIKIAYGGVAATVLRLKKTEKFLLKEVLEKKEGDLFSKAIACLHSEINPISDLRGTSVFRRVLVENLFLDFMRQEVGQKPEKERAGFMCL